MSSSLFLFSQTRSQSRLARKWHLRTARKKKVFIRIPRFASKLRSPMYIFLFIDEFLKIALLQKLLGDFNFIIMLIIESNQIKRWQVNNIFCITQICERKYPSMPIQKNKQHRSNHFYILYIVYNYISLQICWNKKSVMQEKMRNYPLGIMQNTIKIYFLSKKTLTDFDRRI